MEIFSTFIIAQIIGVLQSACSAFGVQLKKREQITFVMVIGGILLCAVQFLLGRYNGLILNAIGTIVALVACFFSYNQKQIPNWLIVGFVVIAIISCAILFQDNYDLIALASQITFVIAMTAKTEKGLRIWLIINVLCWLMYNLLTGGYTLIIGNVIMIISTIISLIRYKDVKKISRYRTVNGKIKNN